MRKKEFVKNLFVCLVLIYIGLVLFDIIFDAKAKQCVKECINASCSCYEHVCTDGQRTGPFGNCGSGTTSAPYNPGGPTNPPGTSAPEPEPECRTQSDCGGGCVCTAGGTCYCESCPGCTTKPPSSDPWHTTKPPGTGGIPTTAPVTTAPPCNPCKKEVSVVIGYSCKPKPTLVETDNANFKDSSCEEYLTPKALDDYCYYCYSRVVYR